MKPSSVALLVSFIPATFAQDAAEEFSHNVDWSKTDNLKTDEQVTINCIECSVKGDISISGGDEDNQPGPKFNTLPFKYDETWLVAQVDNFKVKMDLEFDLTPTNDTIEVIIPLLGKNGITIPTPFTSIFEVDWTFNPILHGWVNATSPVKFTYGFEFEIPTDSAIYFSPGALSSDDDLNITSLNFDKSSINLLPYTSASASSTFDFSLSFRPQFAVEGGLKYTLAIDSLTLDAMAFVDVPQLDISVSQVTDVDKNCQPVAENAPQDQRYEKLTYVRPSLSYNFGWNVSGVDTKEYDLGQERKLETTCLQFDEGEKKLVAVKSPEQNAAGGELGAALGYMAGSMAVVIVLLA